MIVDDSLSDDGTPVMSDLRAAVTQMIDPFDDMLVPIAEYAVEHMAQLETMGYTHEGAEFVASRIHVVMAENMIKKMTEAMVTK